MQLGEVVIGVSGQNPSVPVLINESHLIQIDLIFFGV